MIQTFTQALDFIQSRRPTDFEKIYSGNHSMKRVKYLLELLSNPQETIRVIHIAGTSGKGSTAIFCSKILESANLKIGLTLSPPLKGFLERIQINSLPISQDLFFKYFLEFYPTLLQAEETKKTEYTFFEIVAILAYYIFKQENVDYAVIETGLGGLLDASNTIKNPEKVALITSIGYDHTEVLGKKITQIAKQKAGIIQHGQVAFKTVDQANVTEVFKKHCLETESVLFSVGPRDKKTVGYNKLKTNEYGTKFNFGYDTLWINDIILNQIGDFQALNCSLALAACIYISRRDEFRLDPELVKTNLRSVKIPGRFEKIKYKEQDFIFDLAHNPQKIEAVVNLIQTIYPGQKLNIIFGATKQKNTIKMLQELSKIAKNIILTEYKTVSSDSGKSSQSLVELKEYSQTIKDFDLNKIQIANDMQQALDLATNEKSFKTLVIGSTYLLTEMYDLMHI